MKGYMGKKEMIVEVDQWGNYLDKKVKAIENLFRIFCRTFDICITKMKLDELL